MQCILLVLLLCCINVYFAKQLGSLFDFGVQWPHSVLLLTCPEVPSHIVSFGEATWFVNGPTALAWSVVGCPNPYV